MRYLNFPYKIADNGRTDFTDSPGNIRDMIELILFTNPGERVHRPEFGCGVGRLVFSPNSPEVASTTSYLIQSSLMQELGDLIVVMSVDCESVDSQLIVNVKYSLLDSEEETEERFERSFSK